MFFNKYGWYGRYNIKVIDPISKMILQEDDIDNLITDVALNELRKVFIDGSNDMDVKYVAVGTGTNAPANSDTTLQTENSRFAKSSVANNGTGEVKSIFYLTKSDAEIAIKEVGIFAGSGATASLNSGLLISRILWDFDKSAQEVEVQFTRYDTFSRA